MDSNDKKSRLVVLKRLLSAYPDRNPEAASLQLYIESLSDIPPWLLRRAAETHIRRSLWFPKIAELRRIAAELIGVRDPACPYPFDELPDYACGYLTARAVELEEAFHTSGRLDPTEWEALAEELARANRPHRAETTRSRLRRYLQIATGGSDLLTGELPSEYSYIHPQSVSPSIIAGTDGRSSAQPTTAHKRSVHDRL